MRTMARCYVNNIGAASQSFRKHIADAKSFLDQATSVPRKSTIGLVPISNEKFQYRYVQNVFENFLRQRQPLEIVEI